MFSKIWAGVGWGVLLERFFKARGMEIYGTLVSNSDMFLIGDIIVFRRCVVILRLVSHRTLRVVINKIGGVGFR